MPTPATTRSTEQESRERIQIFREVVSRALGFVRSREITKSFSTIGLNELVDQHIANIEGDQEHRAGQLTRLDRIKTDLENQIEALLETDPDSFRARDTHEDVNTPEDPDDD